MSEVNNTPSSIDEGIPEVTFTLQVSSTQQAPVDDTLSITGMAADAKATGDAIEQAKTDMQTVIDDTEASLQGEIADAKSELQGDIADAKSELQGEIDNLSTDLTSLVSSLFPVGAIYVCTASTAPTFGGASWTWQEIMIPTTWGDLEDGSRSYADKGSGDTPGNLHFWRRTT